MADPSFDVVSKVEHQEVDNALNQASKEVGQRYDFRGTGASIEWSGDELVVITANADDRVLAVLEVFKEKLVKRGVSLKSLEHDEKPKAAGGSTSRLEITLVAGITDEKGKKIVALIKEQGPKGVHAQRQDDQVRVSSKKKDDLQATMALLKGEDFGIPLQFTNYR
jgi:uncharacterized protein YajQ (UPF0234 family)